MMAIWDAGPAVTLILFEVTNANCGELKLQNVVYPDDSTQSQVVEARYSIDSVNRCRSPPTFRLLPT
jgi:hypothetical protein